MTSVYYSLVCDSAGIQEYQWAQSVQSLRRYNDCVEVILVLYGDAREATFDTASWAGVRVVQAGPYRDAFSEFPTHWRAPLAALQLHKLISLRHLSRERPEPLLYLDCDTYFFDDVARLTSAYSQCEWYAREEPGSRRSHHGADPAHIDEDALREIAQREGIVPVPPYNTGVFLVSRDLAVTLAALTDDFLWYAWRLLLGACLWRPQLVDPWLAAMVHDQSQPVERRLALPYPAGSLWILDQIAVWLTLGRVPGLTHELMLRPDVVQNGEYASSSGYAVAHYYTAGGAQFRAYLASMGAV